MRGHLELYRLGVHLRWSDLESLKETDTPLKINLQKLRNIRKRPACVWDETPYVEDVTDEWHHRASVDGWVTPQGFSDPEENLSEGDVEVILVRRKARPQKGEKAKKPDLRYCTIVEVGSDDDQIIEEPIPLPELSDQELLDRMARLRDAYYRDAKQSRSYKRAVKNNSHIREKINELESHRKHFRIRARYPRPGDTREYIQRRLAEIDAGIFHLESQYSVIDPDQEEAKAGIFVPPPDVYSTGPPRPRRTVPSRRYYPSSTSSKSNLSERFLPTARVTVSRSGGATYRCPSCDTYLLEMECANRLCPVRGTRYRSEDYRGGPFSA